MEQAGESACYLFARGFFLMRKFAVLTDTASDLPDSYYVQHDVTPIRLGFTMDGVSYEGEDGAQLDVKEFYKRLRAGSMPTTYQVTPDQAEKAMASLMEAGKDVLAIAFSSGLSGTYERRSGSVKNIPTEKLSSSILSAHRSGRGFSSIMSSKKPTWAPLWKRRRRMPRR